MEQGNLVIVIDTSNYNTNYSEQVPFKAIVTQRFEGVFSIWVRSIISGKEYELYPHQILEMLPIEDIAKILDLSKL